MKKRLLCFFMILVIIVPFILTSCGEDEKDKMKEIILGGGDEEIDRALTLSIWLPTDAISFEGKTADLDELTQEEKIQLSSKYPEVDDFLKRVDAVENAINKELISRNYYTNIDIVPISNEYYEKAIADKFEQLDADSNPFDMNIRGDSDEYANEVVEETVGNSTLYNLLYRPVDSKQLDIFLIRDYNDYSGYEQYVNLINNNYLLPLDKTTDPSETDPAPKTNYITASGSYASINKLIRACFLEQMKYGGYTYALPLNHLYSEQQYFAIDKEIFAKYAKEYNISKFDNFSQIASYIETVASNENGVVPFYSEGLIPAFDAIDLDNLTFGDLAANEILNDDSFIEFVSIYKDLNSKGLVSKSLTDGQNAAVKVFVGTNVEEINAASEDYYLIPVGEHSVSSSEIYSSMLAISTFTVDYDRSMKILNLLLSDSKIITMLQYGIENEDYTIATEKVGEEEVEVLKLTKDTAYKMINLYTGSSYYTFPHENSTIDEWDEVKQANLYATTSKYINVDYYISNSTEANSVFEQRAEYIELAKNAFNEIDEMNAIEFATFINFVKSGETEAPSDALIFESAYEFATSTYYAELIAEYDKIIK